MCPPIGASRYLFHSLQLCGLHRMTKKEIRSRSLLVKEQRTMPSLFSLFRCKCLQFELWNLIQHRTHPETQPQEGRLTLRLLSRWSTPRQPTHALIFHFFLIFLFITLLFIPTLIRLSLCSCCPLTQVWSLIVVFHEQTRHITLLVFVRWSWILCVDAGLDRMWYEWLVHMRGFCFWNWENKSNHTGPLRGLKVHKEMSRWGG